MPALIPDDWEALATWLISYVSPADKRVLDEIAEKYPEVSKTLAHAAMGFVRGRQRGRGES